MADYATTKDTIKVTIDDATLARLLKKFGIPTNIKGWKYLMEAIKLCCEDDNYIEQITKRLYPDVAMKFGTTGSRVERSIRHAIEVATLYTPVSVWEEAFGNMIHPDIGKPTNSMFVATMVELIKYESDHKLFKE